MTRPAARAALANARPPPAPYASFECTSATWLSAITVVANASDGATRRKERYARPSLRSGLVDDGEINGKFIPTATCAALTEAPEHPAPIMASTPLLSNAFCERWSAACRPSMLSHFESRYADIKRVYGNKWSATPSLLLLISRSAWNTPTVGDHSHSG
eukprot:3848654-Prymnesium_polylepis.1